MPTYNYTLSQVAEIVKGTFSGNSGTQIIQKLVLDSRIAGQLNDALFIAIKGKHNDGHHYIPEMIKKGVRSFLVTELPDINLYPECSFVVVPNAVQALQRLASAHRKKFKIPVIGITGSNGKTVVKEWLFQLMQDDKKIVRNPKSYNSQIGVPLSVWAMQEDDELAIFEAGISEPDEMEKLQAVINPTIGIFTNLGPAHDENFINAGHKVAEKLNLFTRVESLVYCADYKHIQERILQSGLHQRIGLFSWSAKPGADLSSVAILSEGKFSRIKAVYKKKNIEIVIPYTDAASTENAINCWCVMLLLGYRPDVISARMLSLSPVAMRLELKEGINNCTLINDSYNSDLQSLTIALDYLHQQKQHRKRTLILSDILQSGRDGEELYSEVAGLIEAKGVDRLIGIGSIITKFQHKFKIPAVFYKDTQDFLKVYSPLMFDREAILLKGARKFGFENIGKLLQQKAHETILQVDLNALISNLNYFRNQLPAETKIMSMVKAFSYGSGSYEIASILQFHRVDYLAVAYADEGVELRNAGITMPIMVMNPDEQSLHSILAYNLEPEIYGFRLLCLLLETLKRRKTKEKTRIHLKFDTGMHRLGFDAKDVPELLSAIKEEKSLRIASVFTHLSAADDATHDAFTKNQIDQFNSIAEQFTRELKYPFLRHVLNTSGVIRHRDAALDMVRIGIGLYGIGNPMLENVCTLKTSISQIREVPAGETVGYNRKGLLAKDSRIGTIPIGYADGLSMRLGNGIGKVEVNGVFVPIIGDVCMDMCMIDLTGIEAAEGDEVIVFGSKYSVSDMAGDAGSIPYNILTSLSKRIKRVYFQ
jgi:Alr-MurF fusion protein